MKAWWIRLWRYALPERPALVCLLVLTALEAALHVLKPWPLKLIIDNVLAAVALPSWLSWIQSLPGGTSSIGLLGWLVAATVLFFFAAYGINILLAFVQAGAGASMGCRLAGALFDRLQGLSLRYHGRQRCGDLVRRVMTDSGCVKDLVFGVQLPLVSATVSLAAMFVVMWHLDRTLSLLALAAAPALVLLMRVFKRPMTERSYEHQQSEGELLAVAEQTLTSLPLVRAFGREEHEDERFRNLSARTLRTYLRSLGAQLGFKVGVTLVTAGGTAGVIAIGGMHVLDGSLSVGDLVVFLSYLASLYAPLETLAYLSSGFAGAAGKARRVLEILDAEDFVRDAPDARPIPSPPGGARGTVRFEGVTFGYEPGRPVLRDVSFEARPGETVAIVGPTGAGKSTLVSLIPRFYDPWEGRVLLDGQDVRQALLADVRRQTAILFQDPHLLPVSIAANISYGRPSASREEIEKAAKVANADGFIRSLDHGYETVIGERGATLSGGEKQRIAIARAVLKDAPILVLDEPASALDARTEADLIEALERVMAGRTTVIIAHRLSTIRRADRIVFLDEGRVVEAGTLGELLAAGGSYSRLHRLQEGTPLEASET